MRSNERAQNTLSASIIPTINKTANVNDFQKITQSIMT